MLCGDTSAAPLLFGGPADGRGDGSGDVPRCVAASRAAISRGDSLDPLGATRVPRGGPRVVGVRREVPATWGGWGGRCWSVFVCL